MKILPQSCYVDDDWNAAPIKFPVSMAFYEDTQGMAGKERAFAISDHSGLMNIHVLRKNSPVVESDFTSTSEV